MLSHEKTPYAARPTEPERLLTVNEIAFRLAISRPTVYRLIRSGALIPVRVGERLRFRVSDLEDYLERGREQGP
jgi:excisionase family DNA binding protein